MFVGKSKRGYTRGGEQWASGKFLILMCSEEDKEPHASKRMRGIVRHVHLHQTGHFMMGSVRIMKNKITLSGSYGGDGLPVTVPKEIYELGHPVPEDLWAAWNTGGGHNSAGSEAPLMQEWALKFTEKKPVQPRGRLKWLREQGFDKSVRVGVKEFLVRCSQCEALVINGVPTHERGCPNARKDNDQ